MARKRRIGLSEAARKDVIDKIKVGRRAAVLVQTECPIGSPEYVAAAAVTPALNKLLGLLDAGEDELSRVPRIPWE